MTNATLESDNVKGNAPHGSEPTTGGLEASEQLDLCAMRMVAI